jgi:microcystin-dependent protein
MGDLYLGEIILFAGNFPPRNTAYCNGQLMSIAENTALFSILGTTYGGDGRTTFALPDLRSRVAVHPGTGPGLSTRKLGQRSGSEINVLNITQLPSHNHAAAGTIQASSLEATATDPANGYPASATYPVDRTTTGPVKAYGAAANENMATNGVTVAVGNTGGGQAVNNMQPWLGVSYIICTEGIFPSRS